MNKQSYIVNISLIFTDFTDNWNNVVTLHFLLLRHVTVVLVNETHKRGAIKI